MRSIPGHSVDRRQHRATPINEADTAIDFNMMPTLFDIGVVPWFDAEKIADAVHQYQDGAKEATYGQDEYQLFMEKLGDILSNIRGNAN